MYVIRLVEQFDGLNGEEEHVLMSRKKQHFCSQTKKDFQIIDKEVVCIREETDSTMKFQNSVKYRYTYS